MRMESFESEVIRIVTVEIVQLIKFLVQMHEGPELGYLVPTFKKRRKRGMEGERGRDGRMEGGRKEIKKRKEEREKKREGDRDSAVHLQSQCWGKTGRYLEIIGKPAYLN